MATTVTQEVASSSLVGPAVLFNQLRTAVLFFAIPATVPYVVHDWISFVGQDQQSRFYLPIRDSIVIGFSQPSIGRETLSTVRHSFSIETDS